MNLNWFENASPGAKIVLTFALMVSFVVIFSFLSMLVAVPIFHKGLLEVMSAASNINNPNNIGILKYFQVVQSIALFVIPPFVLAVLFGSKPSVYLKLNKKPTLELALLSIFILMAFLPFINLTEQVNSRLHFPAFLSGLENWMKTAEANAESLSKAFLNVNTFPALAFNLFMMALIPAIGEELIFRGMFQRLFTEMFKNYHWGILVSAAVFSAFHLQFYGFIPRMLLGMVFGYLLVWSGSMWLPMLAHFVNNAMGVIFYYFFYNGKISDSLEQVGTGNESYMALVSVVVTAMLMYVFWKKTNTKQEVETF